MMEIQNGEAGFINVAKFLRDSGHELLETIEINQGRYRVLKTDKETFLVLFKREFFKNFGKYFRDKGATGLGETVNLDNLKEGVSKGIMKIIFIYPNGHIYSIGLEEFLNNGFRRENKEGKKTISVSIHLLKRENNPDKKQQLLN